MTRPTMRSSATSLLALFSMGCVLWPSYSERQDYPLFTFPILGEVVESGDLPPAACPTSPCEDANLDGAPSIESLEPLGAAKIAGTIDNGSPETTGSGSPGLYGFPLANLSFCAPIEEALSEVLQYFTGDVDIAMVDLEAGPLCLVIDGDPTSEVTTWEATFLRYDTQNRCFDQLPIAYFDGGDTTIAPEVPSARPFEVKEGGRFAVMITNNSPEASSYEIYLLPRAPFEEEDRICLGMDSKVLTKDSFGSGSGR